MPLSSVTRLKDLPPGAFVKSSSLFKTLYISTLINCCDGILKNLPFEKLFQRPGRNFSIAAEVSTCGFPSLSRAISGALAFSVFAA